MFKEYLTEAKKEYKFSIGLAGEMPEGFADELEECLKRYSVNSMSAGKRTPIQERPLDFPQLSYCEVTYFEDHLLIPPHPYWKNIFPNAVLVKDLNIIVRTENDPRIDYPTNKRRRSYEPKLEKKIWTS